MKLVVNNAEPGCAIETMIRRICQEAIDAGAVTFMARWEGPAEWGFGVAPAADTVLLGHYASMKEWMQERGVEKTED